MIESATRVADDVLLTLESVKDVSVCNGCRGA